MISIYYKHKRRRPTWLRRNATVANPSGAPVVVSDPPINKPNVSGEPAPGKTREFIAQF